jgi:acyl-CoA synthetase (AMP-forming)/AMP-acid ligase II
MPVRIGARVEHFLEESARRQPDKIALVTGDRRTTYGELDRASNRIAHLLLASGLQRGDRVVLLLDNSLEAVASIFGVLKANGVYSIVNPQTKASKLAFIVRDLTPRFVITQARSAPLCDAAVAGADSVERV